MEREFATTVDAGSSLGNKTGSWRSDRPVYIDRLPPCNQGCPAGENCQAWLYQAEEGSFQSAWAQIMVDNPLPATMGRACYHPCETACNRTQLDSAVNIHGVERFLGDLAIERGWMPRRPSADTGFRVLVIGAGPSGLAAAYHLRLLGHAVTLVDRAGTTGGMMRFGIPKYRLPREVIDAEIGRILDLGVDLRLSTRVDDIARVMREEGFHACFAAIGAHLSKKVDIPAVDAGRIVDALSLLSRTAAGDESLPLLGRRVAVYGGGNTALDAARTVQRLGDEAVIVYRRTREAMPAHPSEIEDAIEEGVQIRWLSTIESMQDGCLTLEKMRLNEKGWPEPTGERETIEADSVVLAVGQDVDTSLLQAVPDVRLRPDGTVEVDRNLMTGHSGLFSGGDMVPAERTITTATGHGKKAAHSIDAYLRGKSEVVSGEPKAVMFDMLNTWYYSDADPTVQPVLDSIRRRTTFEEVVGGLDESMAVFESRRCMSCGNCFECDNCFAVCPDNAIVKLGPGRRYQINYDYCKGCGMCAEECPCGAVEMVPETL